MSKSVRYSAQLGAALVAIVSMISLSACTNAEQLEPEPQVTTKTLKYELFDLKHRTGDHSTPDAVVFIAPGFDQTQPVDLVIYNHGMMNNVSEVVDQWEIEKQIPLAPPNTVVIMPEWATNPSQLSLEAGDFHKPGFFRAMLTEILSKTPELKAVKPDDLNKISIVSYSGGWNATATQIYKNGFEPKIVSVSMFDSLYKGKILDPWIEKNLDNFASGKKQYHNFYFHTYPYALQQLARIKKMIAQKNIQIPDMIHDTADPKAVMKESRIADNSIVFKNTMIYDDKFSGHQSTAYVYFPQVLKSMAIRQEKELSQVASSEDNKKM